MQAHIAALVLGGFAGFAGIKMVLAGFAINNFAAAGFLKSFSCAFVAFNLWHLRIISGYYLLGELVDGAELAVAGVFGLVSLAITVEMNGPVFFGAVSVM